jgi:hypothetical protein
LRGAAASLWRRGGEAGGRFEKMKDVDPYCCVCFIIITIVLFFA